MAGLDPSGARGRRGARRHRRSRTPCTGPGRPPWCCCPGLVDRAVADVEGAGAATWPATTAWSPSTGAAAAGRAARSAPRRTPTPSTPPTPSRSWMPSASTGRCSSGLSSGAAWAAQVAPSTPSGCRASSRSGRVCASWQPRRPGRARDLHRPQDDTAGLGEVQPPPLARRRLRRLRRVLLRPDVPRAALDPPARGGLAWAHEVAPQTLVDCTPGGSASTGPSPPSWGRCSMRCLPGARAPRQRGPGAPVDDGVRFADSAGGSLVVLDGAGHGPPMRDPVVVNRELDRFVDAGGAGAPGIRRGRRRGAGRGRCAGSARCSCSRRRSGWATPGATWRSSRRCAPSTPTCGCGGWPRTR